MNHLKGQSEAAWRESLAAGGRFLCAGDDYGDARVVLFGVPMDFTTSFRPGTRHGPARVREVSPGIEEFSSYTGRELGDVPFFDAGDVAVTHGDVAGSLERAAAVARGVLADRKVPFGLGGEHLVSLPLILAAARVHPGLRVVHIDAHADLRPDYLGQVDSHATVMRRVAERIGPENVFQFGIRSGSRDEWEYGRGRTRFHPYEVLEPLRRALPELAGRPIYVSIDIDVLDPAFAPGTGTPEPGGITSAELLAAVHALRGQQVVGCDVVEISPPYDPSDRTAVMGALLVREALLSWW